MTKITVADVSKAIAQIDVAMLSTRASNGYVAARPMSNNGDVEYDGINYFFAFDQSHTVRDIEREPRIGLSFVGSKTLVGKRVFVAIEAEAELIREKWHSKSIGTRTSKNGLTREWILPGWSSSRRARFEYIIGRGARNKKSAFDGRSAKAPTLASRRNSAGVDLAKDI